MLSRSTMRYLATGSSCGLFLGIASFNSHGKGPGQKLDVGLKVPGPVACSTQMLPMSKATAYDYLHEANWTPVMEQVSASVDFRSTMAESCFLTEGLDDDIVERLAFGLKVFVPKGTVLVQAGKENDSVFIIGHGQLSVSRNGIRIATLGHGQAVGLREMVMENPAATSVTVESDLAYLLILSHNHFLACFDDHPDILKKAKMLARERELQMMFADGGGKASSSLTVQVTPEELELISKHRNLQKVWSCNKRSN